MNNWAKTIDYHRSLLADKARTESFQRAIAQTVKPGDVVLDLGTGTGILAFFACQAGARRVYAVEVGEVLELAKQVCRKNGFQERVVFLHDSADCVELPEKVDILLSDPDMRLFGAILDARQRFLKHTSTIIPHAVEFFIAPVELPEVYQSIDFWRTDVYDLDCSPVRIFAANNIYPLRVNPGSFLGEPVSLARITFSEAQSPAVGGEVSVMAQRGGVLHGISGWFATQLTAGGVLPHSSPIMRPNWGQTFFPLESPVTVEKDDRVKVSIRSANEAAAWRWQVQVERKVDCGNTSPGKVQFDHSTFLGFPLSHESLRKRASNYAPKLSRRGEAELFLTSLFDGEKTISELERELFRCYADCFKSQQEASSFVREVIMRCT